MADSLIKGFKINNVPYVYDLGEEDGVTLTTTNGKNYILGVDDNGELTTTITDSNTKDKGPTSADANKVYPQEVLDAKDLAKGGLFINSVYCGGIGNDEHSLKRCSHNFVELCNLTDYDYVLDGFSLQYAKDGVDWKKIDLKGIIKKRSTFLIRGKQCSLLDAEYTKIKVKTYDMEWYDDDTNDLIEFSTEGAKFYFKYGTEAYTEANPWAYDSTTSKVVLDTGYVDLAGFDNGSYWTTTIKGGYEGKSLSKGPLRVLSDKYLFCRYYTMDTAKQSFKAAASRQTTTFWEYIDLTKDDGELLPSIEAFTPKSSKENKDFYYNKTVLDKTKPSIITCSMGIQGSAIYNDGGTIDTYHFAKVTPSKGNLYTIVPVTSEGTVDSFTSLPTEVLAGTMYEVTDVSKNYIYDGSEWVEWSEKGRIIGTYIYNGSEWIASDSTIVPYLKKDTSKTYYGATRCFNWVDSIEHKEYLWVRKQGDTSWGTPFESINVENANKNSAVYYYNRIRQEYNDGSVLNVHKQILYNLYKGTYEYVAGYKNDDNTPNLEHCTDIHTFTIKSNDELKDFTFVQTTDQQGFKWNEYEVWKYSSKFITDNETPDFMINTGDMTQNGNRINEWMDYFNGKGEMANMCEMVTVGNNDLSPNIVYEPNYGGDIDKINPANLTLYYTFELDEDNLPVFDITLKDISTSAEKNYVNIYVPSLYSFNYGKVHFLCMNSQITDVSEYSVFLQENTGEVNYSKGYIYHEIKEWAKKDIEKANNDTNVRWKIAYCHEMPFTILTTGTLTTYHSSGKKTVTDGAKRSGSTLNNLTYAEDDKFFSKLCEENGIRLVLGGHKHTQSTTWPLEEVLGNEFTPNIHIAYSDLTDYYKASILVEINDGVLSGNTYPDTWFTGVTSYEYIETEGNVVLENNYTALEELPTANSASTIFVKIGEKYYMKIGISSEDNLSTSPNQTGHLNYTPNYSAYFGNFKLDLVPRYPIYAMSQATGYKHTSNKEKPGPDIPWLKYYFPQKDENTINPEQRYPFYTIWSINDDEIVGTVKKIVGIFNDSGIYTLNINEANTKNGITNSTYFDKVIAVNGIDDDSAKDTKFETKIIIKY